MSTLQEALQHIEQGLDLLTRDFEAEGGRGVELADAIDATALASTRLREMLDLPERVVAPGRYTIPEPERVRATVATDDQRMRVEFNAVRYLSLMAPDEALKLAQCDWGGDYAADEVARYMADFDPAVAALFAYLERVNQTPGHGDAVGFECHVDEGEALSWLLAHRPAILSAIKDEYGYDDIVSLEQFVAEYLENVADQQWPEGVD